eukprot:1892824-Karenia_brevis.AAC.1
MHNAPGNWDFSNPGGIYSCHASPGVFDTVSLEVANAGSLEFESVHNIAYAEQSCQLKDFNAH